MIDLATRPPFRIGGVSKTRFTARSAHPVFDYWDAERRSVISAPIRARLCALNAAFPGAVLRRAPAYTSLREILQQLDPNELEQGFPRYAESLGSSCATAASRFIAIDVKTLLPWA